MKILFLSQVVPYPPHGGILQRSYNLLWELHKYDYEIYLLAFLHPDILHSKEMVEESRRMLGVFCKHVEYFELVPKRSRWHFRKTIAGSLLSQKPFCVLAHRSEQFAERIEAILDCKEIDIIHADTIGLAQFVQEGRGICRVLSHIDIESKLLARRANVENNPFAKLYLRCQAKRVKAYEILHSAKFDMNIMMSEVDEEELTKMVPGVRTSVVPNGVDTEYFQPCNGHDPNSLIHVGGMNSIANKDAVLFFLREIWPQIKRKNPDVKFFAVGQDPPMELMEMSNKDPQIQPTGYVTDVRPLIGRASIYVVPLRIGGGTRLKILDALAMGKAVVSTSIGYEGLRVTPDRNIISADDPNEFAEKTMNLLRNPGKRDALGKAGRKLVEANYSWEIIGRKLHETYEEVVDRKKVSGRGD